MFCNNCGAKLEAGTKFCDKCGNAVEGKLEVKKDFDKSKAVVFATVLISILNAILPFLKWIQVPMFNALSSWMGGRSDIASYNLFGYILSGNSDSFIVTIIMIVLALIALASVLFNIIYAIKTIIGKTDAKNKGIIGSVLLLIMSVLFFVVAGLVQLILKFITMTSTVYVAIILSILNIVLLKNKKTN